MTTRTILLIDDDRIVREIVELCLQDLVGWNVLSVESPLEGLQRAATDHPDAILLDFLLAGMDGLMFLEQLRNNPETQTLPVVLLTARARWLDLKILRQYQVVGIISKPFDPITLPHQIAKLLGWELMLSSS